MTDPTRPTACAWRAVHRLAPAQRIDPRLAAATVSVVFAGELLEALQRRGLLDAQPQPSAPGQPAGPGRVAP